MKQEKITVQQALQAGRALPFAMIRALSQVTLGHTPAGIAEEELLEARFFDAEQEIRVFRYGDELRAVRLCAEADDRILYKTCRIANKRFGGSLTAAQLLESDEDGQTYIAATRLVDWKEEAEHG